MEGWRRGGVTGCSEEVGISNCLNLEEGADEGGWKLAAGGTDHRVKVPLLPSTTSTSRY